MTTWGTMIENLFKKICNENKQTGVQLKLDTWLTTRLPEKNWKVRKKPGDEDYKIKGNNNLGELGAWRRPDRFHRKLVGSMLCTDKRDFYFGSRN